MSTEAIAAKYLLFLVLVGFGVFTALIRYSGTTLSNARNKLFRFPKALRDWIFGEGRHQR